MTFLMLLIGAATLPFLQITAHPPCGELEPAKELLRRGEFKKSAALFEKAVKACPESQDALVHAGFSNFLSGDQRKAEAFLSRAFELNPRDEEAAIWLQVVREEKELSAISQSAFRDEFDESARLLNRHLEQAETDRYWRRYVRVTMPVEVQRVHFFPGLAIAFADNGDFRRAHQMVEILTSEFSEIEPLISGLKTTLAEKEGNFDAAQVLMEQYLQAACSGSLDIQWFPSGLAIEADPGLRLPRPIRQTVPRYTRSGERHGVSGSLKFIGRITAEGRFERLALASLPLGYGMEELTIRTIENEWLFQPAECSDGSKKAMWVTIEVSFSLPD